MESLTSIGRPRFVAALAVSIGCHVLLLMLAYGWRVESVPSRPLVVTMVDRGRGGDGEVGAGAAAPSLAPVVVAPVVAAPAGKTIARPRASQRRRAPSRREVAAPPAIALHATTTAALASTESSADASPVGAAGDVVAASGGAGAVGAGNGGNASGSAAGNGNGSGNDGLRTFCRSCPAPDYPRRARRQGWQGTVDIELAIDPDGAVQEARVDRSSGYPALDEVALGVARQSRFAMSAGGDGLRGQLRYRFVLDETAARR